MSTPVRELTMEKECPRCGGVLRELEREFVLLDAGDVPSFGSRTEITVTPKSALRVHAYRCENPSCMCVEFYAS